MALKKFSTAFVILVAVNTTSEYGNWNPLRRPKLMGDRIPMISINPMQAKVQRNIVFYHNFFRSNVRPRARNMLRMKWHKGAATAAQRWADACILLKHDNVTGRHINFYGPCGQNIFIASHKVPWFFAVQTWWLEKNEFTFGRPNNITIIGHYTQMVWAASHEVGCGIAKCYHYGNYKHTKAKLYYNYVCNYCPIGNRPGQLGRPYRKGKSCGACKNHCKGRLCLNSCKSADQWSNCKQLHKAHPLWLCHTKTHQGKERLLNCMATCTCRHKIHDR